MTGTATDAPPDAGSAAQPSAQPSAQSRPTETALQRITRHGPVAGVRKLWRRLISMRTALVLLFLLAIAAVPGSLLPQRNLNPLRTQQYIDQHGAWGTFLDRIGMFDVFGSAWFAAIYLLLFVSLIGCLVPRIRLYAKSLRTKPLPAPRNLLRLRESTGFDVLGERSAADLAAVARASLGRRWRAIVREEPGGAVAIAAEKGYSREAGNLLFHVSLLTLLICIAIGNLFGYQGTVLVTEGRGFCNSVLTYDSFKSGRLAQDGQVAPFCIDTLNDFQATYRADGSASDFRADITYSRSVDSAPEQYRLKVNSPLRLEGDRVYLLSHGYTPVITVTRPGQPPLTSEAAFVPADLNYTSEGAFKFAGPVGAGNDIGVEGIFAPTSVDHGGVIVSTSPKLGNPVLGLIVYTGDLGLQLGPQSVYSLSATQKDEGKADPTTGLVVRDRKNLAMGETMTLADGTTVTFDSVKEWASLQVSHDPSQRELLIAAVLMVAGLLGSLAIRRRRIWVRFSPAGAGGAAAGAPGDPARTVVSVGGLARSDSGSFPEEFRNVIARLRADLAEAPPSTAESPSTSELPSTTQTGPTRIDEE
ncbi:MAG: ccsB [Jatrophihabitantaceae bacterium]|nr:ccsB [Jatrophihabitantaceae bacterium]